MNRILKIFLFIFLGTLTKLNANHIVGGEIEMIHIGEENSFTYRVKLIQYFDCAQTANPGPDDLISYTIFISLQHIQQYDLVKSAYNILINNNVNDNTVVILRKCIKYLKSLKMLRLEDRTKNNNWLNISIDVENIAQPLKLNNYLKLLKSIMAIYKLDT